MKYAASSIYFPGKFIATVMVFVCLVSGCAELDRLTKPRVEGLQQAPDFDGTSLVAGGVGATLTHSSLNSKKINTDSLQIMLSAAMR